MIVTSSCHDAPVRKLNNGKLFCQTCGQECKPVEQLELPVVIDPVQKD